MLFRSKMFVNNPAPRTKTLIPANTTVFSSAAASASFSNPTGSNTSVYLAEGQVVIQNISKSTESLYISDVQSVKGIFYSPTAPVAGQALFGNLEDYTNKFTVDRGHRTQYYDHASIKLKAGFSIAPGYIIVCCRYYSHSNDSGFFSVDSYQDLNTGIEIGRAHV